MTVSRLKVLAVLPVVTPSISAEEVAYRYAERLNRASDNHGMPVDELAEEIKPAVARALRRLRSINKAEGPPWRRA